MCVRLCVSACLSSVCAAVHVSLCMCLECGCMQIPKHSTCAILPAPSMCAHFFFPTHAHHHPARALSQIASALQFMHNQDIVHGDLSAWNVMLTSMLKGDDSRGWIAKVCDFGELGADQTACAARTSRGQLWKPLRLWAREGERGGCSCAWHGLIQCSVAESRAHVRSVCLPVC